LPHLGEEVDDPAHQRIRLVQVMGGKQHGRAASGQRADDLMYLGVKVRWSTAVTGP
jgi:hypothetical protein